MISKKKTAIFKEIWVCGGLCPCFARCPSFFLSVRLWFFTLLWITNRLLYLMKVVSENINISIKTKFYIQFQGVLTHPCILYRLLHPQIRRPTGSEYTSRKFQSPAQSIGQEWGGKLLKPLLIISFLLQFSQLFLIADLGTHTEQEI